MSDREPVRVQRRWCERCWLASYKSDADADWCDWCRAYKDEPPVGPVVLWGLKPDRTLQTRTPAQVGTWMETGRTPVATSLIRLPDDSSAMLTTMFLCIDHWPETQQDPLVFETRLMMQTGLVLDRFTRRTASYDAATAAHQAVLSELGRIGVRVIPDR